MLYKKKIKVAGVFASGKFAHKCITSFPSWTEGIAGK
jgi:hypothetical protein